MRLRAKKMNSRAILLLVRQSRTLAWKRGEGRKKMSSFHKIISSLEVKYDLPAWTWESAESQETTRQQLPGRQHCHTLDQFFSGQINGVSSPPLLRFKSRVSKGLKDSTIPRLWLLLRNVPK